MFKTLLATFLLSTSVSSSALRHNVIDHNASSGYINTQFTGGYCLKESFEEGVFTDFDDDTYGSTFDFSDVVHWCWNESSHQYSGVDLFTVQFDGDDFNCHVMYADSIDIYPVIQHQTQDFDDIPFFSSTMFYFEALTNMTKAQAYCFRYMFSREPNRNTYNYNGWYTFNITQNYSSTYTFQVFGQISIDNTLYNSLYTSYLNGTSTLTARYQNGNDSYNVTMYDGSCFQTSRVVYMTNYLIPVSMRTKLMTIGTFEYIPDINDSDFADLFFSLADTPIYYITQFLNFELFGLNFGIAVLSIMTLLVIVFVIKKLV